MWILSGTMPCRAPNNVLYYSKGRPRAPLEELELTCDAFPHQCDPYNLKFRMVIPEGDSLGNHPRIRVRLQASNLRKPIEQHSSVRAASKRGDFVQRVNEIALKT
jgi:hypothetical protein